MGKHLEIWIRTSDDKWIISVAEFLHVNALSAHKSCSAAILNIAHFSERTFLPEDLDFKKVFKISVASLSRSKNMFVRKNV